MQEFVISINSIFLLGASGDKSSGPMILIYLKLGFSISHVVGHDNFRSAVSDNRLPEFFFGMFPIPGKVM